MLRREIENRFVPCSLEGLPIDDAVNHDHYFRWSAETVKVGRSYAYTCRQKIRQSR